MVSIQSQLILWVGEKHSGKTTSVAKLVEIACEEEFIVAGILSPALYRNGSLIGFDVLNLKNGTRAPLAIRKTNNKRGGPYTFIADGLKLGGIALSPAAVKSADLIIVDEFGPLELGGDGWSRHVHSLLASSNALVLLVVRQELIHQVQELYINFPSQIIDSSESQSTDKVIGLLKNRRQIQRC